MKAVNRNSTPSRVAYWSLLLLVLAATAAPRASQAQDESPSAYVTDAVEHADGSTENHTPPQATFTAFLNDDHSRVLLDNAPTRKDRNANITEQGRVGLQAGNFPALDGGDSLSIRYTDRAAGERGVLGVRLSDLPTDGLDPTGNFTPFQLDEADFPERPQEVTLEVDEATNARTVTWEDQDGLTYQVYRRALEDKISTGASRKLYHRVATGVAGGQFVDDGGSADSTYAYVVYARDASGAVSAHSAEVEETSQIAGLQAVRTTPHNAVLTWEAFTVPVGRTVGYNIYRRTPDGSYGAPVDYTGVRDTMSGRLVTDTRLEPGQTYYYKIRARSSQRTSNGSYEEFGASSEISVTTKTASDGNYYRYATLDVAVVIYKNAEANEDGSGGRYRTSDKEVRDAQFMLDKARKFFWRNSDMELNVDLTYYTIDEYRDLTSNDLGRTIDDLTSRGVVSTQYDMIFRIDPTVGGFYSIGTVGTSLPGPNREIGFFQLQWPLRYSGPGGEFNEYPGYFPNREMSYGLIWLLIHEGQHAVDAIYSDNDEPQMGHGDFPEVYGRTSIPNDKPGSPGYPKSYTKQFGKRFDFQAAMFRDFDDYTDLRPAWGEIYEAKDADQDSFPGDDARAPLDEDRFGSSSTQADTDGDGYSDKQEATDGIYYYSTSDPRDTDTDGDGTPDGADEHPRYPVNTTVQEADNFQPTVDADVSEWPDSTLVNDAVSFATKGQDGFSPNVHMAYNADSLYVALEMSDIGIPKLAFDFGADGRWYGSGNTIIRPNVTDDKYKRFWSWVASPEVQKCLETGRCTAGGEGENTRTSGDGLWDTNNRYRREFGQQIIDPDDTKLAVERDNRHIQIEMAIPRTEVAGLTLSPGDTLGFYADYSKVGNVPGAHATTFDQWSYVYLTLEGERVDAQPVAQAGEAALQANYPNPFRTQTTVEYTVEQSGSVELAVYDLMGRRVATLARGQRPPGAYTVRWDGTSASGQRVASGMYFYRLEAPSGSLTRTMTVVE